MSKKGMDMRYSTFVFVILTLILSCASPQKNFEKGQYEKAYRGALSELEKGKTRKNKNILNAAFEEMLAQHKSDYNLLMRSNDIIDWEQAFNKREDLIELYLKGERWLSNDVDNVMNVYDGQQDTLAYELASEYKRFGKEAMNEYLMTQDKILAQEAFAYFTKVPLFDAQDDEINQLILESEAAGTVHVLVEADSWDFSDSWAIDREFKNLERYSRNFIQIYYEQPIPNPDCHLEIDFNRLDKDRNQTSYTEDFTKSIQDGYETVIDTSGRSTRVERYIDVRGSVTTTVETYTFTWEARGESRIFSDYCDFRSRRFKVQQTAERKFYNLSGDRRAIPSQYSEGEDRNIRFDEDEIIEDLIEDMYNRVRNHFF